MANEPLKIKNLNNVIRALKQLETPASEISAAGMEAAKIVIRYANLPQAVGGAPERTGALKRSMRPAKVQRGAKVRAGGAKVPYANPIHWGWFKRNIKPNPFFYRALGKNVDEIYKTYADQLRKLIQRVDRSA